MKKLVTGLNSVKHQLLCRLLIIKQPKIQCATTKTTIILSLDMLQWAMFNVHLQDVRDADLGHIQTTAHKTSGFSNYSVGLMLRKGKTPNWISYRG